MKALRQHGLTVVEVLIALVILGVGVMAAAHLQATSLRFTSQAEVLKTTTQLAGGEVEWRRQTELTMGNGLPCASAIPEGYVCTVDVDPCNAVGTSLTLTCGPGLVNPVAYRISVTVDSQRTEPFTLATITTGTYVTGVVGTGETGPEPSNPTDPEEPSDPSDPAPVPCVKWHPNQKDRCLQWGE